MVLLLPPLPIRARCSEMKKAEGRDADLAMDAGAQQGKPARPVDFSIVRPDRNMDCVTASAAAAAASTSSTTTASCSRYRQEEEDVSSLKDYELDEKIEKFRVLASTMKMRDDNRKLLVRLQMFENEKQRRMAGNEVILPINGNTSRVLDNYPQTSETKLVQNLRFQNLGNDYLMVACHMKDMSSSPSRENNVQGILASKRVQESNAQEVPGSKSIAQAPSDSRHVHNLDPPPGGQRCEDVHILHASFQAPSPSPELGKKENSVCTVSRKRSASALAIHTTPDDQQEERQISDSPTMVQPTQRSSYGKRSQPADGDTPDTALELSDEEEGIQERVATCFDGQVHCTQMSIPRRKTLRSTTKRRAGVRVLYPSSRDPEAVEVRYEDLQHLAPLQFLNDTVIDFYIKYIQAERFSEKAESLEGFHFFSCFFYKKLISWKKSKATCFEKLHKWTKGVNIFKKSYLLIPIHDSAHWSLAIICLPWEPKTPYILHLDSMSPAAGHSSEIIYKTLKSYLAAEHDYLLQENQMVDDAVMPSSAVCKRVQVPLQDNEWDCGLFMLYYIERFVQEAPPRWDSSCLSRMFGRSWFQPTEASQLRDTILTLLESIFDQVSR